MKNTLSPASVSVPKLVFGLSKVKVQNNIKDTYTYITELNPKPHIASPS